MKKIILLIFAVVTLCSCEKSNEEKARGLIESQLKTSMNDWSSYEFVEMSEVDSVFTTFVDSDEGEDIRKQLSNLTSKIIEYEVGCNYPILHGKRAQIMKDSIPILKQMEDALQNAYDTKEKEYKGDFIGYKAQFKYRGNNKLGVKIISSSTYFFNPEITEITDQISQDQ